MEKDHVLLFDIKIHMESFHAENYFVNLIPFSRRRPRLSLFPVNRMPGRLNVDLQRLVKRCDRCCFGFTSSFASGGEVD